MPIAGVTDTTGPVVGAEPRDYSEINKLDFMTLLVAQIQNQDPMSPMDNQEFTSQITQFTMLEEMEKTNANLEESLIVGQAINNTGMLSLVGKNVTVEGDQTWVTGGVASESMIATDLPGLATIEVTDETGNVVATYERSVSAGLSSIGWDGKLENGDDAADGKYSISVTLTDTEGEDIPFKTLMTGPVDGLRYESNQAVVMIGGLEFYVSEIYKVS